MEFYLLRLPMESCGILCDLSNETTLSRPGCLNSAIHQINHYPADNTLDFVNTYLLDSDLFGG